MHLYIKNMICQRCKMAVENELRNLKIPFTKVEIGFIHLAYGITVEHRVKLKSALEKYGLEIVENRKSVLIDKVKNLIVDLVHKHDAFLPIRLSHFLQSRLNYDYTYLANLFSETENQTIENYFISQKIERVKALLSYEDLTLSEIAFQLHYSSVAHLSNQFKKVMGITPSQFKLASVKSIETLTAA